MIYQYLKINFEIIEVNNIFAEAALFYKNISHDIIAFSLFSLTSDLDEFNLAITNVSKIKTCNIEALDFFKDKVIKSTKKEQMKLEVLESNLKIGIRSPVMLRKNLEVKIGLMNSFVGSITIIVKTSQILF